MENIYFPHQHRQTDAKSEHFPHSFLGILSLLKTQFSKLLKRENKPIFTALIMQNIVRTIHQLKIISISCKYRTRFARIVTFAPNRNNCKSFSALITQYTYQWQLIPKNDLIPDIIIIKKKKSLKIWAGGDG